MSVTCGDHRGHSLLTLENAVLLPHFGYVSEYAFRAMYVAAVEAIAAFLDPRPEWRPRMRRPSGATSLAARATSRSSAIHLVAGLAMTARRCLPPASRA
ncbi:MAG: hypothetical protein ABSH51_11560 [Solirubrobacteraceae bacterium]